MTFWSRSHSLQRKIITAIVMVGLLPLLLSLGLTYVEERRALRDTIGANFKEVAVEAARRIEMQVTRGVNEAQQLATAPFLRTAVTEANRTYADKDEKTVQSMIRDWQQRWRQRDRKSEFPLFINRIVTNYLIRWHDIRKADYVGIFITDNRGALVVSSIPQVDYYYGKTAWWQSVFKKGLGKVFVSDIFFEPSFGTHVVNVSAPILDDEQHIVIGAVTVLLRRDTLFHSISEVSVGKTGHAMLFNSDGAPLICPILAPEEHNVTADLVGALNSPHAGWTTAANDSHGGMNSVIGFAPVRLGDLTKDSLGGKRWIAFVRQDPEESFAPLSRLVWQVTLYGFCVLAVLWATGLAVARRIARPIGLLHEGVREIGSGRLDQRLNLKTGDEIEHLADAFNSMASNLKQSFGQIEQRMDEVRRLEEKYRDLIENSPEMICQLNKAGQFVHMNKTGIEKLGYSLDEMLAMRLWEIVPTGREPEVLTYLEQLVSHGRSTMETVFLARDGHPIDVEIHATALFEHVGGGLVHSRAFVRDISERRRLEQQIHRYTTQLEQAVNERTRQLVASQERYKALFDLVADSVFMIDAEGIVVAVNKREEQALGYTEERVVGQSILQIVSSAHRDDMVALLQKASGGQRQVPTQEISVRDAKGKETPAEMDLILVGDSDDRLLIMVQLRDITDRKRLERQMQTYQEELEVKVGERTREIEETKQYLENLLENANDVIYTLDSEQCFTYVNSKIEAWGYQKEALLGRPYLSLLSKRHRGRRLKTTLDIGAKQVYEVEVLTQSGEPRSVMVSVSPLHGVEGDILGVLGIARDMTETKKLEQQIRNSEKLASVGKLAAGVAHEINNPLGGILNCLYNLRKGTVSVVRQEEYLASMEDGLRRVQKIVRQLLDFSQQHDPELALANINRVIERVLVLTDHLFVPHRVALETELAPELPELLVDRHMMEQVLMNLILNAIQAMKAGGVLSIRTSISDGQCVIEVKDTGCGISASVLPRIFDPFFTTKSEGEGTGLGLSVSLGIIERHGGRIFVDSEIGRGTRFIVSLPAVKDRYAIGQIS